VSSLSITGLSVSRGNIRAVDDVELTLPDGGALGLLGLNGAGKSSLLGAIAGSLPASAGRITVDEEGIDGLPAWKRCARGIVLVPAGRQLFKDSTVLDNLMIGGHLRSRSERTENLAYVCEVFPILKDKMTQRATDLSGGQQQMLAIARGIMANPRVLMLDEPSEGLAPKVVQDVFDVIGRLRRERDISLIVAEQNPDVLGILDLAAVMTTGRLSTSFPATEVNQSSLEELVFNQVSAQ